jgi:hypothetical protein
LKSSPSRRTTYVPPKAGVPVCSSNLPTASTTTLLEVAPAWKSLPPEGDDRTKE